ncbi:transaldolase [Candidatus Woesearchaeota archaeon]|nr:transaldolase [Candidatus Woesearchaeota archaeon]
MQVFVDTANLDEIRAAMSWGVVDGVTTNPSLIKKEVERLKAAGQQVDMDCHIRNILQTVDAEHPVSLEVTATDAAGMVAQGKALFQKYNQVAQNVVIKIPVNTYAGNSFEGLRAIKSLDDAEIPVNCTLVFTPEQALLAAAAGATYVSPFAGRVDDYIRQQSGIEFSKGDYFPAEGWEAEADEEEDVEEDMLDDNGIVSGVDLVTKIADLFEKHEVDCNIIAASLRNPRQVRQVALAGADIGTIPFAVLKAMMQHAKTKEGMEKFTADIVPEYQALLGGSAPAQPARPTPAQQTQPSAQPKPQPSAHDLINRQRGGG